MPELRRDDSLGAAVSEGAPEIFLTRPVAVQIRGIEEIDAGVECGVHDVRRPRRIEPPPKIIAPEADGGDLE